ncbi:MAG: hypothetical protein JOZ25_12230 [Actinobacteria bacterium]|nr:hypothetical protein [Actinomycetota bacterium]
MTCTECAAESFSAAAKTLVEQGDRCPACGGELVVEPRELMTVPPEEPREAPTGGRFDRDR